MKKRQLAVIALAGIAGFSGTISATTTTTSLDVSVSVPVTCTVSASAVTFNYPQPQASGDVTVTCPQGTPYTIAIDGGQNLAGTSRQMSNGSSFIQYGLYRDANDSIAWGDAGVTISGSTVSDQGTGSAQPHTVYGRAPFSGSELSGNYTDTDLVSVNY